MKNNSKQKYLSMRAFWFVIVVTAVLVLSLICGLIFSQSTELRAVFLFLSLLTIIAQIYLYKRIYKPYMQISKTLDLFSSGYTIEDLFAMQVYISPEVEKSIHRMEEYFATDQALESSKRQAEYLALQNQINPHFLYNTLEGIRGEALMAGQDNIANMTEALSTFFRYTISDVGHSVTVEQELQSVENYFIIQKFRFEDRLNLTVNLPEHKQDALNCYMPKLVLQPIVENAIVHGIEPKVGVGNIIITITITEKRLLITISDDGVGMDKEQLTQLQERLNVRFIDKPEIVKGKRGGIALVNVNNRLKLMYGEEYGLTIYATPGVGTDVEIALPRLCSPHEADLSKQRS